MIRTLWPAVDPVAQRQAHDRPAVEAAAGAAVEVFDGGLADTSAAPSSAGARACVVAPVDLAVHQQRQALLEAQGSHAAAGQSVLAGPLARPSSFSARSWARVVFIIIGVLADVGSLVVAGAAHMGVVRAGPLRRACWRGRWSRLLTRMSRTWR